VITPKIYMHACDSQLNSALPGGLLSTPSVRPISGGFGMPSFVGGLRDGSFGIPGFINMSRRGLRLSEAFKLSGHRDSAPDCIAAISVRVWKQPQAIDANTAKVSTFNKLYKGKYDSHSVGLYPQTDPPPKKKGRAESQGGTIPIS
jgi:hypothetical protein